MFNYNLAIRQYANDECALMRNGEIDKDTAYRLFFVRLKPTFSSDLASKCLLINFGNGAIQLRIPHNASIKLNLDFIKVTYPLQNSGLEMKYEFSTATLPLLFGSADQFYQKILTGLRNL